MNIRKNISNSLRTALLAIPLMGCGATLLLTGCQDDHFDIVSTQPNGDKTLWENIQSRPELSQFADILQSVKYSQTEEKTTNETYADLFNGDQVFTVWAPANGMFDYDYYKELLATGIRDSIYKVENYLIRNNMARYNNVVSGSDSVRLILFNNKYTWLNNGKKTLNNATITEPNIGSSNGVLHITDGSVNYQPNLYEYLAARADLDSIYQFLKQAQTTEFNEDASTQGPTVDGVATWVDSVTYVSNWYTTSYMNAHLNREDSNYVMIIPTNKAWDKVLEQAKKYYKYKTGQYVQNVYDVNTARSNTERRKALTQEQIDSLQNLFAKNAICQNLAFNANWQYERIPITSISDIKKADTRLDSLRATSGMKFKKTGTMNKTNSPNTTVEIDSYAAMFGNADPIAVSNGYAYVVDEYTYPHTTYATNYSMPAQSCFEVASTSVSSRNLANSKETMVFDGENGNTSTTNVWFKLNNICSCKYDIYVVVDYNVAYGQPNRFTATITYNRETGTSVSTYSCKNPNEDAVDATGESLFNKNYFVNKEPTIGEDLTVDRLDTICIAKDFEFPVSYYGLNAVEGLENTFPQLQIGFYIPGSLTNTYTRELRINSIILKSKEW